MRRTGRAGLFTIRTNRVPLGSLGTHEHWNNAAAKQYSRNLAPTGAGIELVATGQAIGVDPISDRVVLAGGGASFTAAATGLAPLTYQWQRQASGVPPGPI